MTTRTSSTQDAARAELVRLLLDLADRHDARMIAGAGIVRAAAAMIATDTRTQPEGDCRCGARIDQPPTGRRRTWCHDCRPARRKVSR